MVSELIWTAFLADNNIAANVSDDSSKVFKAMFPDSSVAAKFECGRTKDSYLVSDGFGPYLHGKVVEKMRARPFSMLIDESNKSYGKKYPHISVRIFEETTSQSSTHFYQSIMLKRSGADDIVSAINEAYNDVNLTMGILRSC